MLLELSPLAHTWILDLDGTIVKHNGYLTDGYDTFLDGAEAFLKSIPKQDMIIFLTSRSEMEREKTKEFLAKNQISYKTIIFEAPYGERIVINDCKPSGLRMAVAVNCERDGKESFDYKINEQL